MTTKPYLLPPDQIERNFADIAPAFSKSEALIEADRCLYCYNAPCTKACPTHIDVPSFIRKIASGNLHGSARVIFDANPIGATCARVCPTSDLCEGACVENTLLKKPIQIGRLQRYATDAFLESGRDLFVAEEENGYSVGIIGAGPAGLSCATYLARMGYAVNVYDKRPLAGGLDTYGMAEYKMQKGDSLAEVAQVERLGVRFHLDTEIGVDVSTDVLMQAHDAIFVAAGLGATTRLGIAGEHTEGVYDALDFIEKIKTREWETVTVGQTVVVIGAGNTAVDAATQAKRMGAERVVMVYRRSEREMPAYAYEYDLAKRDGIAFEWQTSPVAVIAAENGVVSALRCVRTTLGESDERGRRAPVAVPDSLFDIPCDMIIKALGQSKLTEFFATLPGITVDDAGRVLVDGDTMQTENPRIFAGGDCVNGGREAVDAAQMGKRAAQGIHTSISGERIPIAGLWGLDHGDETPLASGATAWGGKA